MLCQICGARAREIYKEDLVAEAPWDLWVAILVLAVAVIGVWEGVKACSRMRTAKTKDLESQGNKGV